MARGVKGTGSSSRMPVPKRRRGGGKKSNATKTVTRKGVRVRDPGTYHYKKGRG